MAINMCDKKGLLQQILSEADISVTSNGILISSSRLTTPRSVPFDEGGKCRSCKANEVEVDMMISKEGITIWCTRMKTVQFVPFDVVYDLPGHCFFKIKNKARVFNIPYGDTPMATCMAQTASQTTPPKAGEHEQKRKAKMALELLENNLMADAVMENEERRKKAKLAFQLLGSILLAESLNGSGGESTNIDNFSMPPPPPPPQESQPPPSQESQHPPPQEAQPPTPQSQEAQPPSPPLRMSDEEMEKTIQEFYDSLSAATTFLGQEQPSKVSKVTEENLD